MSKPNDENQIGVKSFANSPAEDIMLIHVSRSTHIYDLTRTKPKAGAR